MPDLPRRLDEHLLLRLATPADAEAIALFNAKWLSDDGPDQPETGLEIWTRDAFSGRHPTFRAEFATLVEDTRTCEIVSAIMLFPQTWSLDGIPFGVGRPELVATREGYRGRGLIRAQMNTLHAISAARGDMMQVITGIPYFYRQFGYEMALELSGGGVAYLPSLPALPAGEAEPFHLRPASPADIPFIMEAYAHTSLSHRIACVRDEALWHYEIAGRTPGSVVREVISLIETPGGQPVGYLAHRDHIHRRGLAVEFAGILPGVSWREVTPAILRQTWQKAQEMEASDDKTTCEQLIFSLGKSHPIFEIFPHAFPRRRNPYAWYVRIPDLPGFLTHIRPALEARLAASALAGFTGRVRLDFFRSGIELVIERGRITGNEAWQPIPGVEEGHAMIPGLHFTEMICGQKTFSELMAFYADCFVRQEELVSLLDALFPKKLSNVWGVV
jgi:GNAT superfamily N-acetyltransferase